VKSSSLEHRLDGAFGDAAQVSDFFDPQQFASRRLGRGGLFQTAFEERLEVLGVEGGVVKAEKGDGGLEV
jgi:hypothetical protein